MKNAWITWITVHSRTRRGACTAEELKKLDVVLNFEYNRVRKKLTTEQRDSMTKGQRSWLKS